MSLVLSRNALPLHDTPGTGETFLIGRLDKVDVTANGNDVRVELLEPGGAWRTTDPIRVRADTHRSITGLGSAYRRRGGAEGFRLANWTAGLAANADVEAYTIE
jgi:hypothetical protein